MTCGAGMLGAEKWRAVLAERYVVRIEGRAPEDLALLDAQQLTRAAVAVEDFGRRPLDDHADLQGVEQPARRRVELDGRDDGVGLWSRDVALDLGPLALRIPQGHSLPRSRANACVEGIGDRCRRAPDEKHYLALHVLVKKRLPTRGCAAPPVLAS